jgi:CheY-like chemotaxis protein
VTDTGEGMTEEVRSRVFEPFFTTKELGKGTGLGLATCHGIVKALAGHIEVYSELGHGTMFRIHLPSKGGSADPRPVAPSATPAATGTETVLVVEDEPRVRRLAVLGLRAYGYTVLEAADGADAIRVALGAGDTIDLVVSDVMMPGMSGPALIRELSALIPRARALLMSGHADATVLAEVAEPGRAFLAKPYTPDRLARRVREILDAPAVE